jgi:AraC-like DNA-binding protein
MQPITLEGVHVAILLGAIQGFFLAGVLATKQRNRTANRLLAVAMFAFSAQMISVVYHAAEFERVFPHFFGVAFPLALLYGPLIYLYSVTASDRTRGLRLWDTLHFLPFVFTVIVGLPIYLMSGAEKIEFYHQLQQGIRPPLVRIVDTLKYVSGISYSAVTIIHLRRHQIRVKDSYSSIEHVNLQWLLKLATAGAVIWFGAAVIHFTGPDVHPLFEREDDIVALAVAIFVYGVGYMGLRQPEIFNIATGEYPVPVLGPTEPGSISCQRMASEPASELEVARRYERSGLSDKEASALKDVLLTAMNHERPYRNSDLTLADLAALLGTTPHKLSEVLNSQLNQSFYDFVNAYRVREVQRRIADDLSQNLTLLSLALDAGFASKSTFNNAFKKHTGSTPSGYRHSVATAASTTTGED